MICEKFFFSKFFIARNTLRSRSPMGRSWPLAIVNDPDRGGEAQLQRALAHHQRVFGIVNAAAQHRVDVHVKQRVLGQDLQLLVEHLQALLRHVVRHHVVDADLHVIEARRRSIDSRAAASADSRW